MLRVGTLVVRRALTDKLGSGRLLGASVDCRGNVAALFREVCSAQLFFFFFWCSAGYVEQDEKKMTKDENKAMS